MFIGGQVGHYQLCVINPHSSREKNVQPQKQSKQQSGNVGIVHATVVKKEQTQEIQQVKGHECENSEKPFVIV
jgi:hypothetical protein